LVGDIVTVDTVLPPELPPLPTTVPVLPPPPPPPPSISSVMLEHPDGIVIVCAPPVVNVVVTGVNTEFPIANKILRIPLTS
jgi:hypothetical protein